MIRDFLYKNCQAIPSCVKILAIKLILYLARKRKLVLFSVPSFDLETIRYRRCSQKLMKQL